MQENTSQDFIDRIERLFDKTEPKSEEREAFKDLAVEALKGTIMKFLIKAAEEATVKDVDYDSYIKYHGYGQEPQNVEFDKDSILNLKKYL